MTRSGLCDYSDAYIVIKWTLHLLAAATNENDKAEQEFAFKNYTPFKSCISKINNALIDNVEDLDTVIIMYNLLEYNHNYSMTSEILRTYYRNEIDDNASDSKSFDYKTKIVGETPKIPPQPENAGEAGQSAQPLVASLNVEVTIPLKYLCNFRISVNLLLMNCEIELDLLSAKDCILIEHHNNITRVNFMNTSTELLCPSCHFIHKR